MKCCTCIDGEPSTSRSIARCFKANDQIEHLIGTDEVTKESPKKEGQFAIVQYYGGGGLRNCSCSYRCVELTRRSAGACNPGSPACQAWSLFCSFVQGDNEDAGGVVV